jgi:hypothetical protein
MFNALLSPTGSERAALDRVPKSTRRRVPLVPVRQAALLGAAVLHFCVLGGCAMETRPGDGLVDDGLEVTVAPTTVWVDRDAGLDAGKGEACKALPVFEQKVMPHFLNACAPKCHDGTKSKAATALPMLDVKSAPADYCGLTLGKVVGKDLPDKLQAQVLTSVDPARPDKVHDFKYKPEEFGPYRDDVLMWINAEQQP